MITWNTQQPIRKGSRWVTDSVVDLTVNISNNNLLPGTQSKKSWLELKDITFPAKLRDIPKVEKKELYRH